MTDATTTANDGGEGLKPDELIPYKKVGDVELSLHIFRPDGADGNRPGILFFFGGAWRGRSPSQFYPHCRYLASRGMVAIGGEYRVELQHGTTPFECVTDGKSAMRWVRAHADELGLDPARIASGGGSAGGHVAAACATVEEFDDPSDDLAVSPRPDALVLFNPVFDNSPDGWGHDRVEERWEVFSPAHNIREGHPPTIVFVGSEDTALPIPIAERYRKRMAAVGSRHDLFIYPGQPHAFFNYGDGSNPYYSATVYEADRFLASLGYTTGPPTIQPDDVDVIRPSEEGSCS